MDCKGTREMTREELLKENYELRTIMKLNREESQKYIFGLETTITRQFLVIKEFNKIIAMPSEAIEQAQDNIEYASGL